MKIFITGITGLLGRHVAEQCVRDGHEILALVRDKKINKSNFLFDLNICYGDLTDIHSFSESIDSSEIIIHCAANTSMFSFKNLKQEETNISGVKNLITATRNANIKKFIFISSANTILPGDRICPGDESVKLTTKNFRLPYINTKITGEEILLNEFKVNSFPVIILNPTFIIGPKDLNLSSGKLILSAIKKKIPFYPSGGKNVVDVRDVAKAVTNSINMGELGSNYLLCNENLTYKEIFLLSCDYAKVAAPKYKMPNYLGIIIGCFGTFFEFITNRSIAINHKTIKLSFENNYYKADKAKKELNFIARPAKETIKDTVNWFMNEYV